MYPGEPDHTTRADVESSRGGPLRLHPAFPRAPLAPSPYTEEVDLDCWSGVVVVVVYPPIIDDIHSVLDPVQIWIYPLMECVTRKLCQWLQTESHVIPQGGAMSIVSLSVSLFY
ncbi:hypothetical protein F9C07_1636 [Aspergillus flavus]|uniref:Uncharacterized protein n=4 Tax=Aspergillus subgen. Circumdati TaxID=2720871 RepID=A0A7U2MRT7_ASPFN|nr:unnamed protein product [Aspergillus oryzae RIB40]EIT79106.1 hypothetical protein Ao3042_04466 [Aspergillus oryzae 3.042]KAB8240690.1 hypothetical protein BDV35DRAFT_385617 [Aspergillus flavus]QRD88653.1 hypothetical protein F9C07_1636 [Aspergillus flavus]BAE56526.1 unnamed protein product [Aspergillus oryzae RIB40]|eukprot:EIT79106.1 hypothetical protein Ao3042_04466 [Aspergillus oryzae 3.042]